MYGDAALFVVHGPVTWLASSKVPRGHVSVTFAPERWIDNDTGWPFTPTEYSVCISARDSERVKTTTSSTLPAKLRAPSLLLLISSVPIFQLLPKTSLVWAIALTGV